MKHIYIILILFFSFSFLRSTAQVSLDSTVLDTTTLISGLDIPWEITWGPDSFIWCTESYGRISRIDPESGTQHILLDHNVPVYQSGESGMLGMAFHPNFLDTSIIYVAYTYLEGSSVKEKLVSFDYTGDSLINESIILDNIVGNSTHDGCRLLVLPDRTLLMTTGDAQNQALPQDTSKLNGKILRMNLDGTVPNDNPFPGNYVYSYGHRNAQGLFLAPNGKLYSSEHGPTTDDELNIIKAGENYGWPNVHGYCDTPGEISFCNLNNVQEPIKAWTPTVAASDLIWYDHDAIPEWKGKLLMTSLKNKRIYQIELDSTGENVAGIEQLFNQYWGRLRDICAAPDGSVFLATSGNDWTNDKPFSHKIIKLKNSSYTPPNGIQQKKRAQEIYLYPNPAQAEINISFPEEMIGKEFSVFDMLGKLILRKSINQTNIQLPSPGQGLYYLQAEQQVKRMVFTAR